MVGVQTLALQTLLFQARAHPNMWYEASQTDELPCFCLQSRAWPSMQTQQHSWACKQQSRDWQQDGVTFTDSLSTICNCHRLACFSQPGYSWCRHHV